MLKQYSFLKEPEQNEKQSVDNFCGACMKIAIDARMIRYSGIGTYIRSLLDEYGKLPCAGDFLVFGNYSELKQFKNLNVRNLNAPVYSITEQLVLPLKIRAVSVFHAPHYNAPLFYRGRLVVTIHDIIHVKFPEYLPSKKAYLYARYMLRTAARKARILITDSVNTKNDLIKYFEVPPGKIRVIPLGVDNKFHMVEDKALLSAFRKKHTLPQDFILYAGNLKEHKNLSTLLRAFKLLKVEKKITENLVLTTGGNPVPQKLLRQVFKEGMEAWTIFLPFIPDDEMPLLYNCAKVFAFPSLYEGFGLPPLEAMACGVPVVSSNAASLPEVLGDSAIMCGPKDFNAFAEGIHSLITDESFRIKVIAKGKNRAGNYSWAVTAKKTIDVYREL